MTRRPHSHTPEERAFAISDPSYMASGHSYISVIMRDDNKHGRVPYYRDPSKCDHSFSMCPTWDCIESWSMDYKVNLHLTVAGRDLASQLNINPAKFAFAEHNRLEYLKREDFTITQS